MADAPAFRPLPLSPSRVSDFKTCPLLFKFRVVDRLPEPEDPYSARGSLVHAVLERVLGLAPEDRTFDRALISLEEIWGEQRPLIDELGMSDEERQGWLEQVRDLLRNYFLLEDPARVEPHELEWSVEHTAERVTLRGIIDRVEVLPDGSWILTDYKTGASPSESRSLGSFFGLRFYALLCWRAFGRMPKELRLVHLRKPEVIRLIPTEQMLEGLERQLEAVGSAIRRAYKTGDWRPRPGPLCNWCPHRQICPAWAESEQAV
jgi:putative RecB family exonuclease